MRNEWLEQFFIEVNKTRYNNMIMPKIWDILNEILEKTGFDEHRIVYLGLYGSQNYRMDTPNSDIDCECFIFPSENDNKWVLVQMLQTNNTKYAIILSFVFGLVPISSSETSFSIFVLVLLL